MKKLVLSLLCAGAMSVSANAMALIDGATYLASITNGPFGVTPVGSLSFSLVGDVARTACLWDVEWANNAATGQALPVVPPSILAFGGLSTELFLDQMKVQLGAGCNTNAAFGNTLIVLDTTVTPAGTQFGFNRQGVPLPINMLMLGQDGLTVPGQAPFTDSASGLICFGGLGAVGIPSGLIASVVNGFQISVPSIL